MPILDTLWHRILRSPYRLRVSADIGKGTDVVVLLHGIASSGEAWNPLLSRIDTTSQRVIALDLLGFGESPKPDWQGYSVAEHADAVIYTLARLGVGHRQLTIIGHSMGCLVATHIATRRHKHVKRLILYEPPLLADDPEKRMLAWRQARYRAIYGYIAAHPELLQLQQKRLWRLAQRLSGLRMDEARWLPFERSLHNTIMRQTAYKELHNIQVPTDIIHGRLDFVVIRAGAKRRLRENKYITLHLVSEYHGITARAARYILQVLRQTR